MVVNSYPVIVVVGDIEIYSLSESFNAFVAWKGHLHSGYCETVMDAILTVEKMEADE